MKKKIVLLIAVIAAMFAVMAVSASACRPVPFNQDNLTECGEISLGKTEVSTEGDECLHYTFTPDEDGFYALSYRDSECAFVREYEEDGETYKCFYQYITNCEYITEDSCITNELVEMEKGKTYDLCVMDPAALGYEFEEDRQPDSGMTDTIRLSYIGTLVDYNITNTDLTFYEDTSYDYNGNEINTFSVNSVEEWEEDGVTYRYLYTCFDAIFSEGNIYSGCSLRENACNNYPLEIVNDVEFKEGTNTVRLDLLGIQKDFEVTCSYNADSFMTYCEEGFLTEWGTRFDTLSANLNTAVKVLFGTEGIGGPRVSLGMNIINKAFRYFFASIFDSFYFA